MIVVADSSPLHYLILIDQVDLLRSFYDQVILPNVVADELSAPGSPSIVRTWIERPPAWASITAVSTSQIASVTEDLDIGERAAIALAGAIHADLLLIDDAAGRAEAKRRSIRVTGTLGVLRAGAERGMLDVPDMLTKLRGTSFYLDEALMNTLFAQWLPR